MRSFEDDLSKLPHDRTKSLGIDDAAQGRIAEMFRTKDGLFQLAKTKIAAMNPGQLKALEDEVRHFTIGLMKLETIASSGDVISSSDLDFYIRLKAVVEYKETESLSSRIEKYWKKYTFRQAMPSLILTIIGLLIALGLLIIAYTRNKP